MKSLLLRMTLVVVSTLFAFLLISCDSGNTGEGSVQNVATYDDDDRDDDRDDDERPGDGTPGALNLSAIHRASSSQYNDNCVDCHSTIHTQANPDADIPMAHVAMLAFAPGEDRSESCVWCHRSIEPFQNVQRLEVLKSSIRKSIKPELCAMCHGPAGPAKQFYQSSLSAYDGGQLYDLVCAGCHKPLAVSEVAGESLLEIQEAIGENEGGMGVLDALSSSHLSAIATALTQVTGSQNGGAEND